MQIITYLGFTLLSIFIQFVVMDFIQGRLKNEENQSDLKGISHKRQFQDVLKEITYQPHALYYQTDKRKQEKNPAKLISNNSLIEILATTEIPTTVFDIIYEANSTTNTDEGYTTESLYTSTEFENMENITEISLFENKYGNTTKPNSVPKKAVVKECKCNFLYNTCDINCCCDSDCSDSELTLFPKCAQELNKTIISKSNQDSCYSHLPYFGFGNGLFCIVKTNLPEEREIVYSEIDISPTNNFLLWTSVQNPNFEYYEYSNQVYKYGDPVWLLKNGSIYHIDLPAAMINNYCSERKPMKFLKDEKYECNVSIRDLEMLQISKSLEEATVISATALSMNSSVLNCSNLHCVNWTLIACDISSCTKYRKDLHEPTCTENICTNLALKIVYTLYYHDSKIVNATIQYHIQNVTLDRQIMTQAIQVKFLLANESINRIITLSGSPGYIDGLPMIVSYAEKNYSDIFFNITQKTKDYLELPENINGLCIFTNRSENIILFGRNRQTKCRYNHKIIKESRSYTNTCKIIQNNILNLLGNSFKTLVSPLGNPINLEDKDWVTLENENSLEGSLYGEILDNGKFRCFNLITRYSLVFRFAQINGDNRILSCKYRTTAFNVTFNSEDVSTIITIDVNFVDIRKPGIVEYASSPNLNIHLPKDFFYPFHSDASRAYRSNLLIKILNCVIMTMVACK